MNTRAYGFSRSGSVKHILTGVDDALLERGRGTRWTAVCGAKVAIANDLARPPVSWAPAGTCKRCATGLGMTVQEVK